MPIEEQLADARQTFEGQGYTLIEESDRTLLFRDESGGILRGDGRRGGLDRIPAATVVSFRKAVPCISSSGIGRRL